MTDPVLIFVNPAAGRGRAASIAARAAAALTRQSLRVHVITDPPDQALLPSDAARAAATIIIGGDGTLRDVTQRFIDLGTPVPPILLLPMGTANLMATHLGQRACPTDVESFVTAALNHPRLRRVDVARINGRIFLAVVGAGLDGHVVHEFARRRRGPIRAASYVLPVLQALAQYEYPPLTVTADGRTLFDDGPALAFVANIPEYGTGVPLLPHARSDDGLLDLFILPCCSFDKVLTLFMDTAASRHLDIEGAITTRARHITIASSTPVPLQADGEPAGHTPTVIDLLDLKLQFITPI